MKKYKKIINIAKLSILIIEALISNNIKINKYNKSQILLKNLIFFLQSKKCENQNKI